MIKALDSHSHEPDGQSPQIFALNKIGLLTLLNIAVLTFLYTQGTHHVGVLIVMGVAAMRLLSQFACLFLPSNAVQRYGSLVYFVLSILLTWYGAFGAFIMILDGFRAPLLVGYLLLSILNYVDFSPALKIAMKSGPHSSP